MKKEQSLIRANCAQACLKLELFSDAFTHCCECVKLDKTNHKGYYRRAEARKALIRTSMDYGDCTDVVKDYLKCHEILQPCTEAFCQAVILAVKYGECGGYFRGQGWGIVVILLFFWNFRCKNLGGTFYLLPPYLLIGHALMYS